MKCLFVTSEAQPFAASGGLADVSGALPHALRQRLIGCRIVMPLYDEIPQSLKDSMRFVTSFSVPVSWRRQYCGVFELNHNGVIYYFIDNEYYFKRSGLYGYYDDAERFAFFSRACLEMLPYVDFKPDIIHDQTPGPLALAVFRYAKKRNIPIVSTDHAYPDNLTQQVKLPELAKKPINKAMNAYFLTKYLIFFS